MGRLLSDDPDPTRRPRAGAMQLAILGTVYGNSAAKFWSGLVDELAEDFPQCDSVVLSAPATEKLGRKLMFPQDSLAEDFESLMQLSLEDVIREVTTELELLGPPSGVTISLLADDKMFRSEELPLESVDANIFGYLLAWLLEWAQVPEANWNDGTVDGNVVAGDSERRLRYGLDVRLKNEHVSEGLMQRTLSLRFSRRPDRASHSEAK